MDESQKNQIVPEQKVDAAPEENQTSLTAYEAFLSPHKIPGFVGILLGIIFGISNWRGAIDLLVPGIGTLGGWAAMMVSLLSSPVVPALLIFWGGFYLWWSGDRNHWTPEDRSAVQLIGWLIPLIFILPLCSVALFGLFISSSHISELSSYVFHQMQQRHVNEELLKSSFEDLRKTSSSFPEFHVLCVPSREAEQFASELIKNLRDAGFHISDPDHKERYHYPDMPEIIQTPYANMVGIQIVAQDNYEARKSATTLANALNKIGIETLLKVRSTDQMSDLLYLLIGDHL